MKGTTTNNKGKTEKITNNIYMLYSTYMQTIKTKFSQRNYKGKFDENHIFKNNYYSE